MNPSHAERDAHGVESVGIDGHGADAEVDFADASRYQRAVHGQKCPVIVV
jgi:hypothetical protein